MPVRHGRRPRTDFVIPVPPDMLPTSIPIRSAAVAAPSLNPPATAPVDRRWRLARLASAPHRVGFFAGAVMLALTAVWWAASLALRHAGVAVPWAVVPPVAHGLAMALGFMPLFMVGFLYTAGPRWLGQPPVEGEALVPAVAGYMAGALVAGVGFHVHALLAAAGLALAGTAWAVLLARYLRLLRTSPVPDRLHATGVAAACGLGLLAMAVAVIALAAGAVPWARAAVHLALWGFLAPTFAIVSHRMIPFFTAAALPSMDAWRPNALLGAMLLALGVAAAAEVAQVLGGPLPAWLHGAVGVMLLPAAALLGWLAVRWGLVQSLSIRLLAMLHGGFVWLAVALGLAAVSHLRVAFHGEAAGLGLAPLHALTMGYLGATLVAMITRVVAGHSGRPLAADNMAWALYWTLQAAALARVGVALAPALPPSLTLLAAHLWVAACAGWALRYGAWLGQPRVDGRPG